MATGVEINNLLLEFWEAESTDIVHLCLFLGMREPTKEGGRAF